MREISFLEKEHEYRYGNEEFISVTTAIKEFVPEFDPEGKICKSYALKNGLGEEEVKKRWQEANEKACEMGTAIHKAAELTLLGMREQVHLPEEHYKKYLMQVDQFIDRNQFDLLATEVILYSEEYKIAGQADFLTFNPDGTVDVWDWKTSKRIVTGNQWDSYLLADLSHLPNNNYTKYSLQLSIYRKLLELWGIKGNKLYIVHVLPTKSTIYECPYMAREAELILESCRSGE